MVMTVVDIEDYLELGDGSRNHSLLGAHVQQHVRQRAEEGPGEDGGAALETATCEAAPAACPGTQRIFVKTFGCAHNSSDSEYMMGQLQEYGFK